MKFKAMHGVLLSAAILLLFSPAVNAFIIQPHSPVTLLVTDPTGLYKIGCLDSSCTSAASPKFVDTIPAGEGASYAFCATPTSTVCPSVTVTNPTPGTWTVQYFSTLTGDEVGHVYITVKQCVSGACTTINIVGTPTDPVPLKQGSSGAAPFYVNPTGTLQVPQFPLGLAVLVGLLAPALLVLSRVHRARQSGP